MQNEARSEPHADSQQESQGTAPRGERRNVLPGQLTPGHTGSGPGGLRPAGLHRRRPDPNRSTVRLLLYFAAVLGLNPGLIFSSLASDLCIYGDSSPRPLACHQQATHPPQYICAGHRPAACTPVRPSPGQLRYFRAVLPADPQASTNVADSRRASGDACSGAGIRAGITASVPRTGGIR